MISDRNVRFLAVLSMVMLFVSGVGVGFALSRLFIDSRPPGPPRHQRPGKTGVLDNFARELNLSEQQKASVHEIMEAGRKEAEQIMAESRPRVVAIAKKLEQQISAVLDTQQRKVHQKLLESGRGLPARNPANAPPGRHPAGGPPGHHPPGGHPRHHPPGGPPGQDPPAAH